MISRLARMGRGVKQGTLRTELQENMRKKALLHIYINARFYSTARAVPWESRYALHEPGVTPLGRGPRT